MKIKDLECIPLLSLSRGLHLPSTIFVDAQYMDSIVNSLIKVLWSCVSSILKRVKFGLCPCLGVGCAKKYAQMIHISV